MKSFWSLLFVIIGLCDLVKNSKVSNCDLKFYGCDFDYKQNQCLCQVQRGLCSNPFQYKSRITCMKQNEHRKTTTSPTSSSSYCKYQSHGCYYEPKEERCYCKTFCLEEKEKFLYNTAKECIKKMNSNPCKNSSVCENKGKCVALKRGKFQCDCTGTKSYGQTCQKRCPDPSHLTLSSMQQLYEENKDWWQNTQFSCLF